jgi:hypothetical protein
MSPNNCRKLNPPTSDAQPDHQADMGAPVELRLDPPAPKANALPILCRLLRRLVEREDAERAGVGESASAT